MKKTAEELALYTLYAIMILVLIHNLAVMLKIYQIIPYTILGMIVAGILFAIFVLAHFYTQAFPSLIISAVHGNLKRVKSIVEKKVSIYIRTTKVL